MILSGISLAIVALLGWIWLTRGFFPAFLNLVCCLAAGAIAFSVWEPVAYMMLGKVDGNGAMGGIVWSVALALPFAVAMGLLRALVDVCCPNNMKFDKATNAIGGALCGAASGVITSGILVISIGFLRVERDFMDYNPVTAQANGGFREDKSLMFPVDSITAAFYKHVSNGALATGTPLARWYPDLEYVPGAMRYSFGRGKGRNTIDLKDFDVWKRFTVGGKDTSLPDLLRDDWQPTVPQNVADAQGENFPPGSTIQGFVLNFQPSSRERSGSVVLGNSQVRLLVEKAGSNERKTIFPVAVISQAQSEKVGFARFRFDAPETYISSIGGASETRMGFEFPVPPGYEPIALYVKNARVALSSTNKITTFADAHERDTAIRKGTLFEKPAEMDTITDNRPKTQVGPPKDSELEIRFSPGYKYVIQKGQERGMQYTDNSLVEGHEVFEIRVLEKNRGIERSLQISQFQTKPDTVVTQIDVTAGKPLSWLGKVPVTETTPAPQLFDTDGQAYDAIGYIFEEQGKFITYHINRGKPIRTMADLPSLSASRSDQTLTLVFDVSKGVKLARMAIGTNVIHEFKPPMPTVDR